MRKISLYPSIMCANTWQLKEYLELFEETGMKAIHFDVVDGHFVPNITMGVCEFDAIRKLSTLPIDLHLMCNEPELFIDYFDLRENDRVGFHPETTKDPVALAKSIKDRGLKVAYVLSPDTDIECLKPVLEIIDCVQVMAVYPGFAGQKMLDSHPAKLKSVSDLCEGYDIEIIADGNTTSANTITMYENGARGFVAGTSSLFKGDVSDFKNNLQTYLQEIDGELI